VAEAGLPGFEVIGWFGWLAPAATPKPIVARLHADIVRALKLPDVRDRLLSQSTEPVGNSPQAFAAFMKSEHSKWAKVIKAANVKVE
jgi:tripartite-type tricarboxylate transporter receptor subunit TctC